jgi:flagellar biosynthesis GTPase FlhF
MDQAIEVRAAELPPASIETLKQLRNENCSSTSKDFKLQSFQLFLRRILSPDSPTRNMLLFHGTGVGKTCTAIQIAEEYILRPEFQDKKVLVLASAAVQENVGRILKTETS